MKEKRYIKSALLTVLCVTFLTTSGICTDKVSAVTSAQAEVNSEHAAVHLDTENKNELVVPMGVKEVPKASVKDNNEYSFRTLPANSKVAIPLPKEEKAKKKTLKQNSAKEGVNEAVPVKTEVKENPAEVKPAQSDSAPVEGTKAGENNNGISTMPLKEKLNVNVSDVQKVTKPVETTSLEIVKAPKNFLNMPVIVNAKFDKFTTLGLDYKPAFKSSEEYISFLIKRDDSSYDIPLSEMKFFIKRAEAEKFIDLKTNDEIKIEGVVFSDALGDAWVDVTKLTVTKKVPRDDEKKVTDNTQTTESDK